MWEQYKRTFGKTQTAIVLVTAATYLYLGQVVSRSAVFFFVMQVGAVLGAAWGVRLRKKVDSKAW